MIEKLKKIEEGIEFSQNFPLEKKQEYLEPLFDSVYQELKKGEEDIKSLLKLSQLENSLDIRMLEVCPKLEPSLEMEREEQVLEQIVYYTRKKAIDLYHCDIKKDSLRTRSLDFCNLLLEVSKGLQVPASILDIGAHFHFPYPHYIVIAYTNHQFYLMDCTYQQFFLLGYNFENRYYAYPSYPRTCEIGGRMLGARRRSAERMIIEGYLPVNSEDFKNYCDACSEFGNIEKEANSISYLKALLKPIERSSDKFDRILVSKL